MRLVVAIVVGNVLDWVFSFGLSLIIGVFVGISVVRSGQYHSAAEMQAAIDASGMLAWGFLAGALASFLAGFVAALIAGRSPMLCGCLSALSGAAIALAELMAGATGTSYQLALGSLILAPMLGLLGGASTGIFVPSRR